MLMTTREKRPASRTLRGWAIAVLQEAGAIKECEEHGWMQDRADPHARQRAFDIAREERPPGVSPQAATVAIGRALWNSGPLRNFSSPNWLSPGLALRNPAHG
jgi:hypothetical protein